MKHVVPAEGRGSTLRLGPLAWALVVLLGLSAIPYGVPVLSREAMRWYSDSVVIPALAILGVTAVLLGLGAIPDARERQFWRLIAATLALQAVVALLSWTYWESETADLVDDFLYLAFYAALLFAQHLSPDQSDLDRARGTEGLRVAGTLVFLGALASYYLVIPAVRAPAEYLTWVPSLLLFGTLDCYVFVGFLRLWHRAATPRWRTQGIVSSHRGAIHVDSEPGRGTEFRVYLPTQSSVAEEVSEVSA